MRRSVLNFPDGWSGLALLALRLSLAGVLVLAPFAAPLPAFASAAGDGLAAALALGVLTRFAAALAVLATLAAAFLAHDVAGGAIALHGLGGVALALLGAGAYSIDARLFGRRVITLDDGARDRAPPPKG